MGDAWRLYGERTLAARLERTEIPGLIRKKIVVGPHDAAIIVRDGEPQQVLTAAAAQAANAFDQLRALVGTAADVQVFFVSLAPFELAIYLGSSFTESAASESRHKESATGRQDAGDQARKSSRRQAGGGGLVGLAKRLLGFSPAALDQASARVGWSGSNERTAAVSSATTTTTDFSRVELAALAADGEPIQAVVRLGLRVDADQAGAVAGLLRGKRALATWDLESLIRDTWFAQVMVPEIARHTAAELRGNRELRAALEGETQSALAAALSPRGIAVESASIAWGLTEPERIEIARRRAAREEEARDFAKQRTVAQLARDQDVERIRLGNLQELQTAEARGDQDLRDLLLTGELGRELLVHANRVDRAEIDARIRDVTLEIERKESVARLEQRRAEEEQRLDIEEREFRQRQAALLARIDAEDKEMSAMVRMRIEVDTQEHERAMVVRRHEAETEYRRQQTELEARFRERKMRAEETLSRMAMQERLLAQGLTAGVADASVLRTMLEQATEQEYAGGSDAMVASRAQAQAAAKNVDTFRAAQADERSHQAAMTGLSARMMDAAKQPPAPVILGGGPAAAAPGPVFVSMPGPAPATGPQFASPQAQGHACAACGQPVQAAWKACPACGGRLGGGCPHCGGAVQPGWKACPACAGPL